jgi:hypothetical protein
MGQSVGTYTADQLEAGIELEGNEKTPQYQQALQVALLNKKRNDEAYRPIRDQYGTLKGKRRDLQKGDPMRTTRNSTQKRRNSTNGIRR